MVSSVFTKEQMLLIIRMQSQDAMEFLSSGRIMCIAGVVNYDCVTCNKLTCNYSKLARTYSDEK